ncbi:tetratricopeptide repeat protein [Sediminitomix flava]|uniref:Outer membrane protein assembly factor BamD (BamD/ComL family) n=1 Tax=Sediminitomix flava TaxID=379075 RepID=A0A315ZC34_SEDFL|nr:tetratricopeptide repeat protein [Sediminitomix flava]PWJ42294.1 outer membrane protein assembly factor BamD (BamD/ComL family) [Sediminitomix flava]
MAKHKLLIGLLAVSANAALAQQSISDKNQNQIYQEAVLHFEDEKYALAQKEFSSIEKDLFNDKKINADFYLAVCKLNDENLDDSSGLLKWIENNPFHNKKAEANFYLAKNLFGKEDYFQASKYLKAKPRLDIYSEHKVESDYMKAYSAFVIGKDKEARNIFEKLKKSDNPYQLQAYYYAGFIALKNKKFDEALKNFEKALKDKQYTEKCNEHIPEIYNNREEYNKTITFLTDKSELTSVQSLLLGEAYFHKKDYEKAAESFKKYADSSSKLTREQYFRLGYSQFKIGYEVEAIPNLNKAADGEDQLAQNAAYYLGIAHISIKNKQLAIAAFNKARTLEHDQNIRENAAYYLARVSLDVKDYQSAITSCDYYFSNFKEGEHLQDIYNISTTAYLNTGDYNKALEHIEKIKTKNQQIKEAYQEIAFNKAVQDFNDGKTSEALHMLSKSLEYPYDRQLKNEAYFWKGEIFASNKEYSKAIQNYARVSKSSDKSTDALYGTAYSYFNSKEYEQAKTYFKQFLRNGKGTTRATLADALVRLADCYLAEKDYEKALETFDLSISNGSAEIDYIAYQKGIANRFSDHFKDAKENFEVVIYSYKSSVYRDKSLYQLGIMYSDRNEFGRAASYFSTLIEEYPESPLNLYAYNKRALAYKAAGDLKAAADNFKALIEKEPSGQFAENAIRQLEDINGSGMKVNDLQNYKEIFSKANPESLAIVQAEFEQAKKPFANENYVQAISKLNEFIEKNPTSALLDEANYTLGVAYKLTKDYNNAASAFRTINSNTFKEKALRNLAEVEQRLGEYAKAFNSFKELNRITTNKRYKLLAYRGLMQTAFIIEDYVATDTYANALIEQGGNRYAMEAELYIGKTYLKQHKHQKAIEQLQKVTTISENMYGAEAQFLIGQALREQEKFEESTEELISIRRKYESYTKWLYKAYLLIAENYIDLENFFQAKATLKSIAEYSTDETVKVKAQERLDWLEEKTKKIEADTLQQQTSVETMDSTNVQEASN